MMGSRIVADPAHDSGGKRDRYLAGEDPRTEDYDEIEGWAEVYAELIEVEQQLISTVRTLIPSTSERTRKEIEKRQPPCADRGSSPLSAPVRLLEAPLGGAGTLCLCLARLPLLRSPRTRSLSYRDVSSLTFVADRGARAPRNSLPRTSGEYPGAARGRGPSRMLRRRNGWRDAASMSSASVPRSCCRGLDDVSESILWESSDRSPV